MLREFEKTLVEFTSAHAEAVSIKHLNTFSKILKVTILWSILQGVYKCCSNKLINFFKQASLTK